MRTTGDFLNDPNPTKDWISKTKQDPNPEKD